MAQMEKWEKVSHFQYWGGGLGACICGRGLSVEMGFKFGDGGLSLEVGV